MSEWFQDIAEGRVFGFVLFYSPDEWLGEMVGRAFDSFVSFLWNYSEKPDCCAHQNRGEMLCSPGGLRTSIDFFGSGAGMDIILLTQILSLHSTNCVYTVYGDEDDQYQGIRIPGVEIDEARGRELFRCHHPAFAGGTEISCGFCQITSPRSQGRACGFGYTRKTGAR